MLSNSARDVDNVALKHDETMLMNASPVTGTPGMTQPFSLVVLLMLLSVLGSASTAVAQQTTEPLQTEWGHPDLEGVWNFSSDIPFQRPEEFGYREFLTPEEISTIQTRLSAEAAAGGRVSPDAAMADRGAPSTDERFVYGYDHFWYEMAPIADPVRTSQIIYPKNGQLPALIAGALRGQSGFLADAQGQRPVRTGSGGIGKDGLECHSLPPRILVPYLDVPVFKESNSFV